MQYRCKQYFELYSVSVIFIFSGKFRCKLYTIQAYLLLLHSGKQACKQASKQAVQACIAGNIYLLGTSIYMQRTIRNSNFHESKILVARLRGNFLRPTFCFCFRRNDFKAKVDGNKAIPLAECLPCFYLFTPILHRHLGPVKFSFSPVK